MMEDPLTIKHGRIGNLHKISLNKNLLLSVVPIIFLVIVGLISSFVGPHYSANNVDPDYAYLLNALGILNGQAPMHTDHPGTPLQLFAALIIYIKYLLVSIFKNTSSVSEEVLKNPESYINTITWTITSLITVFYFIAGLRIYRLSRSLLKAISFQITSLFFTAILFSMTRLSPEPFLVLLIVMISIVLFPAILGEEGNFSWKQSLFLGVLIGCTVATKLNALPLIFLLIFLKRFKKIIFGFGISMVSFVVFTIPIIDKYPKVWQWINQLVLHTGSYGNGNTLLPDLGTLWGNLKLLFSGERFYFVIVGILAAAWLLGCWYSIFRKNQMTGGRKLHTAIGIFLLINLVQIVITIRSPSTRYLVPAMCLLGLEALALVEMIQSLQLIPTFPKKYFSWVLVALGALGLTLVLIQNVNYVQNVQTLNTINQWIDVQVENKYSKCVFIYKYGASSLRYALAFGDHYESNYFSKSLYKFYPNELFIFGDNIENFRGTVVRTAKIETMLQNGECILLWGRPVDENIQNDFLGSLKLEALYLDSREALYKIVK